MAQVVYSASDDGAPSAKLRACLEDACGIDWRCNSIQSHDLILKYSSLLMYGTLLFVIAPAVRLQASILTVTIFAMVSGIWVV
eukprot:4134920-Amphidinium_carterae.1